MNVYDISPSCENMGRLVAMWNPIALFYLVWLWVQTSEENNLEYVQVFSSQKRKSCLALQTFRWDNQQTFVSREMLREKLWRTPYTWKWSVCWFSHPGFYHSHPIFRPMQTCRHAALGQRAVVDDMVKDLFEKLAEGKVPWSNLCVALDICVGSTWFSNSN